jgi:hypothetical protein
VVVAVREAVGAGTTVTKTVSMNLHAGLCVMLFVRTLRFTLVGSWDELSVWLQAVSEE